LRVKGERLRVQGRELRVQGEGLRVEGWWVGVYRVFHDHLADDSLEPLAGGLG